jgi:HK97 family phage prohead protease
MDTYDTAERRAFLLRDLKAIDDDAGIFEGYLAVFGNKDLNDDIIDRGAFTKTLREAHETKARNRSAFLFPLLWQHNTHEPIGGLIDAKEDSYGLWVRGQYDLNIELGRRAYSGAKTGYLRGMSIGFEIVKSMRDASGTRHLLEIRLYEGSLVTMPANTEALVTSVKAAQRGDKNSASTYYQVLDEGCMYDLTEREFDEARAADVFSDRAMAWPISARLHDRMKAQAAYLERKAMHWLERHKAELTKELWRDGDTPNQTAERVERYWVQEQRERARASQADLDAHRTWLAEVKAARDNHTDPPPHYLHNRKAYARWKEAQRVIQVNDYMRRDQRRHD